MATFNAGAIEATLDLDVDPFQRKIADARAEGRRFAQEKWTATLGLDDGAASSELAVMRRELERVARNYTADLEVRGLAGATAEVAALEGQLAALGEHHTIELDTDATAAGLGKVNRGIRGMIAPLAILATGLIPLTAAAVPVLGLANNLTLASAAAGGSALAFLGIGKAFKAMSEADLDPSAENLQKMHDAMEKLAPDAREFVTQLRSMGGDFGELQRTAASGFFPDVNAGLANVNLDDYRSLIFTLSSVGGEQVGNVLDALDNPRWTEFFGFLEAEAKPGVDALGESVGNLAGFFSSLWQAFDPLNDDFSDWLVNATRDARDWADSLREGGANSGEFGEFIAYVREQGPEAAEALGAVGGAILDVVEAAAPLGGVVLDTLQAVGNAVSFIADQPFGDELLMGAAALFTFNKAMGGASALLTKVGMGPSAGTAAAGGTGFGGLFTGVGEKAAGAGRGIRGFGQDLKTMGTTALTAGARTERELTRSREAALRLRGGLATAGKGAAALGAVTLASTGLSDQLHLTNTAMGALMGTMVAPGIGTAIGAGVGYVMDFAAAAGRASDAVKEWNDAFDDNAMNISGQNDVIAEATKQYNAYRDDVTSSNVGEYLANSFDPTVIADFTKEAFGAQTGSEAMAEGLQKLKDRADAMQGAAAVFADGFGMNVAADDAAGLTAVLEQATPAMNALKISADDLENASPEQLERYGDQIARWQHYADSGAGRMHAFADSVADLGAEALSTADSANQMSAALEALLAPSLNLEQATDDWHKALQTLEADLKSGAGFKGFSEQAMANRQATRDYVSTSMERLKALAGVSTTSERDMANAVAATREQFIQSGIAAGFSRKAMVSRANAMKLTPELVETVFRAAGIDETDLKARKLRDVYRSLPKDVQTDLKANGIPTTEAAVDHLVEKYKLTEKQRTALVNLRDMATGDMVAILAKLGLIDSKTATPQIVLNGAAVSSTLGNVSAWLDNLDGKTATTWVTTRRVGSMGATHATGGPIKGPGTGTSDSIPIWASNDEHMWTAREVANAGGHAAVEAIRAQFRYADGGPVQAPVMKRLSARTVAASVSGGAAARAARGIGPGDVDRLVEAILASRSVYARVSSKAELRQALNAIESELRNG